MLDQALEQLAGERRQALVLKIADHGQQLAQAFPPLGGDDPELGQARPQGIDRGGALLEQLLAHPVQHQQRLLASLFTGTNRMPGRCTASQQASASAASCLFVLT